MFCLFLPIVLILFHSLGNPTALTILLQNGADPNTRNALGLKPIHLGIESEEMISLWLVIFVVWVVILLFVISIASYYIVFLDLSLSILLTLIFLSLFYVPSHNEPLTCSGQPR
jgi:hypothetical protein